jgi:hypothetical protein
LKRQKSLKEGNVMQVFFQDESQTTLAEEHQNRLQGMSDWEQERFSEKL